MQLTVVYDGWVDVGGGNDESDPSSANATIVINDDRTSADFALLSDTTVNQQAPLAGSTTQATYNLRVTSIYNFQSAYNATNIALGCSVVSYTNTSGVTSTPSGLACGFDSALSTTTKGVNFKTNSVPINGNPSGFINQPLYVGPATGYGIASNGSAPAPAARWWVTGGGTALACIFLLGLPGRRRHWQSLLGAFAVAILGFSMTGCGVTVASGSQHDYYSGLTGSGTGGGSLAPNGNVPAGTYTVLVTATTTTNTTLTHTLPVQVIVGNN